MPIVDSGDNEKQRRADLNWVKQLSNLIIIFLLSVPSGVFLHLSGSTLAFWLKDCEFDNISIGLFALANFLHVFKFLWGPYLENISFLKQHKNGFKSCMVFSLLGCIISILILSLLSPKSQLLFFCLTLLSLSFFSASFEMLIHASQILLVDKRSWGLSEAFCITGYRLGMLLSGSLALYMSTFLPWKDVYQFMGGLCVVILILAAIYPFKELEGKEEPQSLFVYFEPFKDFLQNKNLLILVIFFMTYRLQDNILGKMPSMYLLEVGFSKANLAFAYKAFGLFSAVVGGFVGGYLCRKLAYKYIFRRVLILYSLAGLLFLLFLHFGANIKILYLVVLVHEFCKGLTLTPFFSYQLRCCNIKYSITQIAIITSIVELSRIIFAVASGYLATYLGWNWFFIISSSTILFNILCIDNLPEQTGKKI
jgi:predicted MFS family arabinose efflux permease